MARTLRAHHRLCRRVGEALCGMPGCPALKRPYPPGQHGRTQRRRLSPYGRQLLEKQKLKFIYGVTERQLRNYYARAARARGRTGELLVQFLEMRLDNVVYRLGFAPSLPAARQMVVHGHIEVNGRRVDRPGYALRPGDTVAVREKSRDLQRVRTAMEAAPEPPPYLAVDREACRGTLLRLPGREEVPARVDEGLVVEFYAR